MNRIVGLETEYGCLTGTPASSFSAVERVRDWIFGQEQYGLIDVHHRDWDEPPGNGGFFFQGGGGFIFFGPPSNFSPPGPFPMERTFLYTPAAPLWVRAGYAPRGAGGGDTFCNNTSRH